MENIKVKHETQEKIKRIYFTVTELKLNRDDMVPPVPKPKRFEQNPRAIAKGLFSNENHTSDKWRGTGKTNN